MTVRPLVKVINLGLIRYEKALAIQSNAVKNMISSGEDSVLYLLEHNPVYTVGIRDKSYTVELENKLKQLNADFFRSNRGGLITFHGPGQLVAYPIINLRKFNLTLKKYICLLEKSAILTAKKFDIVANTTKDIGVWVNDNKLASIGVHASRFITSHGIAINSNVDLTWFEHIVPCGVEGKGVTSLSKELNRNVSICETSLAFKHSFSEVFGCRLQLDSETEHISY